MTTLSRALLLFFVGGLLMTTLNLDEISAENSVVRFETSKGDIIVELFDDKAPLSVKNMIQYVDEGFYSDTIFHRVIPNFMIQGGGLNDNLQPKKTHSPIKNESPNGLSNTRGTLAMARTNVVDSATAQFFINVVDNPFLNFRAPTPEGYGYAVFGKVKTGMDVVDKIRDVKTGTVGFYQDVPKDTVLIKKASILRRGSAAPTLNEEEVETPTK
jgi:cyclophilin family peptidyl-prolyl cis-trans isomerase